MSRTKKRKRETPMPAASAGLLRFYGEKTDSIVKVRPEFVVIITVVLIVSVLLGHIFLGGLI
jgi:preprotein translocase subunit Sec61beta